MENIVMISVGLLLLIMGYLIGVQQKINLVHSYHYKRVKDDDKPSFCKGVGLGNALVGVGVLLFPVLNSFLGETATLCLTGILVVIGLGFALAIIIKYNKGLF